MNEQINDPLRGRKPRAQLRRLEEELEFLESKEYVFLKKGDEVRFIYDRGYGGGIVRGFFKCFKKGLFGGRNLVVGSVREEYDNGEVVVYNTADYNEKRIYNLALINGEI